MYQNRFVFLSVLSMATLVSVSARADQPLGSAFAYQGQLKWGGVPLDGFADFRFSVWSASSGGQQIGTEYQINGVTVANGLFTVHVDLGVDAFTGDARWLQISVRYPTEAGSFVGLTPRQIVTPAPYASYAHGTRGMLVVGSDVLFAEGGGRVGIGTTSPKQALHNEGDYYGKGHLWLHAFEGDGQSGTAYVQARDDSASSSIDLRLRTQLDGAPVEAMTLKSTGQVGIGTASPQHRLDVNGAARFSAAAGPNVIIHDTNGSSDRPGIQFTNNSSHFIAGDDLSNESFGFYSAFGNQRANDAILTIHGNTQGTTGTWNRYLALTHDGTDGRISTDTGALLLNPAGNIGAKTSSPLAPLHVGAAGANWSWSQGNGWGDFCLGNGSVGLAVGVAAGGGGAGDVRLWTKGGTERLFMGNPTDGVTVTLDDGRVGVPGTNADSRLNVTSLALAAPAQDWAAHFKDANGTGEVWLAGDDGEGRDKGIVAQGTKVGGQFYDINGTGDARLAYTNPENHRFGVWGRGNTGGYFESSDVGRSKAWVGGPLAGVRAESDFGGGLFEDPDDSGWAKVGWGSSKVYGNGSVSFVQNHPYDRTRTIVYTAPEGDEVATYTRGTARLLNGEARVVLGETFQWVTNPDIGLTAHLTPRGDCEGLYVASVTTSEMIVRELRGGVSNVAFDYIVYGLRIGFEEVAVVQAKEREAPTPSMAAHHAEYEKNPPLRAFNALERFKRMRAGTGETHPVDLSAATALSEAIVNVDPAQRESTPP